LFIICYYLRRSQSECNTINGDINTDSLVFVGEFQPINDDYKPINGNNIMESYLLKNSSNNSTSNKMYCIGQVNNNNNNNNQKYSSVGNDSMETITSVRFISKPWQYLYDAMKVRATRNIDTTSHCFVVSVLEPYYSGNLYMLCYTLVLLQDSSISINISILYN